MMGNHQNQRLSLYKAWSHGPMWPRMWLGCGYDVESPRRGCVAGAIAVTSPATEADGDTAATQPCHQKLTLPLLHELSSAGSWPFLLRPFWIVILVYDWIQVWMQSFSNVHGGTAIESWIILLPPPSSSHPLPLPLFIPSSLTIGPYPAPSVR